MSAVSDLVNGWPGGIIQASRHGVFVPPLYHANALYATHLGRTRLRTNVEGPIFEAPREGRGVPYLDAVASRSADGRLIYLKVVNTDPARAIDTRIELRGASVGGDAEWDVLASDDPAARNSFAAPDAIVPRRERVAAGRSFTLRVPARSVSVVTLRVAR
jgi:alpha-N-arabinofuranosidase